MTKLSFEIIVMCKFSYFVQDVSKLRTLLKGASKMPLNKIQRCMSFTEKIVVGQISGKVMHSGKVMYMSFTENSFKEMLEILALLKQAISTIKVKGFVN